MTPVSLFFLLNTKGFGSYRSSVSTMGGTVTDRSENPTPPSLLLYLPPTLHLFVLSMSSLLSPLSLRLPSLLALLPNMLPSYVLSFHSSRIWVLSLSTLLLLFFPFSVPCNLSKYAPFGCSYSILPVLFSDLFALHSDRISIPKVLPWRSWLPWCLLAVASN